jgi:hypothetical protein
MHTRLLCVALLTPLSVVRAVSTVGAQSQGLAPSSADVDGDGRPELVLLDSQGGLRLVRGPDGGRFEDLTVRAGLGALEGASCAAVLDLDADGDLDLFAGSAPQRVWLNVGAGRFLPASSGIEHEEFDLALYALDMQGDGLIDLWLDTERGPRLYTNLGAGQFELLELDATIELGSPAVAQRDWRTPQASELDELDAEPQDAATRARRRLGRWRRWTAAVASSSGSSSAGGPFAAASAPSQPNCNRVIYDHGAAVCIGANSIPTLGQLYPLSTDFNVSGAGNVGIGTIAPAAKLDVVGGIRASGALTAGGALDTLGLRVTPRTIAPMPQTTIESTNVVVGVLNSVSPFAVGATVSGGGYRETITGTPFGAIVNERPNRANDNYCTVAGGMLNLAGRLNPSSVSVPEAPHATVSGGRFNAAVAADSTICGGYFNEAEAQFSAVLGGESNRAGGYASATLGGSDNEAFGDWSVAAGRRAGAGEGCFVFADSTNADFNSTAANQFLIRASGGVGIGGNAPEAPLHVLEGSAGVVDPNTSSVAVLERDANCFLQLLAPDANESGVLFGNPTDGAAAGAIVYNSTVDDGFAFRVGGNLTKAVLDKNGRLGVGTSSPSTVMHLAQAGSPTIRIQDLDAGGATYHVGIGGADDSLRIAETGVGDRIVVARSSGFVGVGTASPSFLLHVNGTAGKPGGGSWSVASDARLKTNVAELDGALAKLLELRGVTYEYKDPAAIHELGGEQAGFLAQEVERVFPEWVETGADGYKRLSIRGFEALTVEALRELRNEAAERAERDAARIANLEAQMEELKALVQASLGSGNAR